MRKLFTLLAGIMLSCLTFSMSANTVTFYFLDGTDGYQLGDDRYTYVSIFNEDTENSVTLTENFLNFQYSSETTLRIGPENFDYEIVVKPQNEDNGEGYILTKKENQYYLNLTTANDIEFQVFVYFEGQVPGEETVNYSLSFQIKGEGISNPWLDISASYWNRESFSEEEIPLPSGSVEDVSVPAGSSITITPDEGFIIKNIECFNSYISISPEDNDITAPWTIYLDEDPDESFTSAMINITVAEKPKSVTVNFTAASQSINVSLEDCVNLNSNGTENLIDSKYTLYYPGDDDLTFSLSPVPGYLIEGVTIKTSEGTTVTEDQYSSYGISETVSEGNYSYTLTESAADLSFTFAINENEPAQVYFYFKDEEGETLEDAGEYVFIYNRTTDEALELTGPFYNLKYSGETTLSFSSSNLDYKVLIEPVDYSVEEFISLGYGDIYFDEDAGWILTLNGTKANDIEFNVIVEPKEQTEKEVSVYLNFYYASTESEITDPAQYVEVSYFDKVNFKEVEVTPLTNTSLSVVSGTSIDISPLKGYIISNIITYNFGVVTVSEPSDILEEWTIAVAEDPTGDFASLEIYLAEAPATVEVKFATHSVGNDPQNYVTITGNVDLNEVSNTVVIPEDGIEFTIAPSEAYDETYLIPVVNIVDSFGAAVSVNNLATYGAMLTGNEESGYTVTLSEDSNGLSFTFEVESEEYVTGVKVLGTLSESNTIYNLQGQKVNGNTIQSGIYIVNGKKVYIRK